jgi:hypothetical protein
MTPTIVAGIINLSLQSFASLTSWRTRFGSHGLLIALFVGAAMRFRSSLVWLLTLKQRRIGRICSVRSQAEGRPECIIDSLQTHQAAQLLYDRLHHHGRDVIGHEY